MESVRERINNLPEDAAKELAKALRSFSCYRVDGFNCNACPLCQSDENCLCVLIEYRTNYGKC